ncbi:MAG: acyl-CoA dehydratase activase [Planctomycetota bacterium]
MAHRDIAVGVDAGSRTVKIVLLDAASRRAVASGLADQGVDQAARAAGLLERLLEENASAKEALGPVVATGYGRKSIAFADRSVTEIMCHGRGIHHRLPGAQCIVDIGGQDSKYIQLDEHGTVRDFAMNDRCAAGTGCFLEVVARRLEVSLEELGDMASRSEDPAEITSKCVVFAETEIVGLLAGGAEPADVAAGVQSAIASRVASMVAGSGDGPVVFSGGVALISGVDEALSKALDRPVRVAPDPQMTGALGAALLACEDA